LKRRDGRWFGSGALDVFEKIPFMKFIVGRYSSLTVIVIGSVIDYFEEFGLMYRVVVDHDRKELSRESSK